MAAIIGVDIGATTIKAGVVRNGKVVQKSVVPTESKKGRAIVLENIYACIDSLMSNNVSAIGVGCPGPLDLKKGIVLKTPNIPLQGVRLIESLRKRYNMPIVIENDATAYIYGEALYGAGKGKKNIVGLTIGTGIGGAIIINKDIYRGRGNAGELGHMSISYRGIKGVHGDRGELEEYVSLRGVLRQCHGLKVNTPKDLFDLAAKGNKEALKAWDREGFYLGVAVADLILAFDPDLIIIGGNIANAWKYFSGTMKKTVKKRALFPPCPIVKRKLANSAGILGSADLARRSR